MGDAPLGRGCIACAGTAMSSRRAAIPPNNTKRVDRCIDISPSWLPVSEGQPTPTGRGFPGLPWSRWLLAACCLVAAAVPAPAGGQVVSFTTEGAGVLHAGARSFPLAQRSARVELARSRGGWTLAVGGRTVGGFARRP